MVVMVALLRGVNVGGRGALAMADLRNIATGLGYEQVSTYIQSGNLVFSSKVRDPAAVGAELEAAIARSTSVSPLVVVRTAGEMMAVVEHNPFPDLDPTKIHVVFGTGAVERGPDDLDSYDPEAAAVVGRELFLYLPDGVGRSKLAADLGRRASAGTMRNWRTVTKLVEMAAAVH